MNRLKTFETFHGYGPQKKRTLIKQKLKFIPLIEELTDDADRCFAEVHQGDRFTAMSFIKSGSPSEWYLEKVLSILRSNGVDTSSIEEVEAN